jgi:nucleotide-binding universal stress UspA family protein
MFKKILACLDGSKFAEQILPYAAEQAARFDGELVLLCVLSTLDLPVAAGIGSQEYVKKQIQAEEEIKAYLNGLAGRMLSGQKVRLETLVVKGTVGASIVGYARDNGIDLIAIATHGQGGVKRMAFGSVTDQVLRNSDIPLLVIRPTAGDK